MKVGEQQKFIAMASKGPIWGQQPRETGKSFEAFLVFRELGPTRSIGEVSRMFAKSHTLIRRWSIQWDWYVRAAAWDEHIQETRDKAAIDEAKRMGIRQARLGMKMQEKGEARLETLPVESLTAQDTVRLIKEGAELERVARGEDKGESGGNIIFNINMKTLPTWAPAGIVKNIQKAIEGEVKEKVDTNAD